MKRKSIVLTVLLSLALLILPLAAFAHGVNFTLTEPGVLKAEYDGGGFSPRMEVTLYDADGKEIESGTVDDNGEYHFDEGTEFAYAEVDDGMGHKATYKVGQGESIEIPKLPVIIGVFALIAVIFIIYSRRKSSKSAAA